MEKKTRWQIAKKKYSCNLCGEKIKKGEEHKSWWNKPSDIEWEGEFENYRMHKNCWKFEQYYLEWNDYEGWSDEDISDSIDDLINSFPNKKWNTEFIYDDVNLKIASKLVKNIDWEQQAHNPPADR